jgi:hypothetical protein
MRVPQPMPAHAGQTQLLASWLELPVDEIVPVEWRPPSVLNTKASEFTPAGLRAERISIGFAPKGTGRRLRRVFGSSK